MKLVESGQTITIEGLEEGELVLCMGQTQHGDYYLLKGDELDCLCRKGMRKVFSYGMIIFNPGKEDQKVYPIELGERTKEGGVVKFFLEDAENRLQWSPGEIVLNGEKLSAFVTV